MKHKEAFALMWYACKCGHRERIWNSRDGVTPFGIQCPSCGKLECHHVDWHLDEPAPDHKPHKGQQFFRDGTADDAIAIINRRIDRHPDMPPDIQTHLLNDARKQTGEWCQGWPMMDRAAPKQEATNGRE